MLPSSSFLFSINTFKVYLFSLLLASSLSGISQNKEPNERLLFIKQNVSIPIDARIDFSFHDYEKKYGDFQTDYRFQFSDFIVQVNGLLTKQIGYNFRTVFYNSTIGDNGIWNNIQNANVTYTTKSAKVVLSNRAKGF